MSLSLHLFVILIILCTGNVSSSLAHVLIRAILNYAKAQELKYIKKFSQELPLSLMLLFSVQLTLALAISQLLLKIPFLLSLNSNSPCATIPSVLLKIQIDQVYHIFFFLHYQLSQKAIRWVWLDSDTVNSQCFVSISPVVIYIHLTFILINLSCL